MQEGSPESGKPHTVDFRHGLDHGEHLLTPIAQAMASTQSYVFLQSRYPHLVLYPSE